MEINVSRQRSDFDLEKELRFEHSAYCTTVLSSEREKLAFLTTVEGKDWKNNSKTCSYN